MSRFEKLLHRFQTRPRDFTYEELRRLLKGLGYAELTEGKTSGSRVAFYHSNRNHIIRLHRPHPAKELKRYQIDDVLNELRRIGAIE